jgi:acyl-CoA thioester hydrolase
VITLELRIDWSDLDLFGHVNSLAFLKYIQAARVNYWERIGLYQAFLATKQGSMLASVRCEFRKPLYYPGAVIVRTRMAFMGNTSFGFDHELVDGHGEVVAAASDVMVSFDFAANEKTRFPDELRRAVAQLERSSITPP